MTNKVHTLPLLLMEMRSHYCLPDKKRKKEGKSVEFYDQEWTFSEDKPQKCGNSDGSNVELG